MPRTGGETKVRISALAKIAQRGRFGAGEGAPGIELSVRHPVSIISVISRRDQFQQLAKILAAKKDCEVHWAGFEQFYVHKDDCAEGELYQTLKQELCALASVIDQGHGRVIIRVSGCKARAVLAKGTPVDLHADEYPVGRCAVTQMAHVGVHLVRNGSDSFELSIFRGFAESFWEWLTTQSEEFGYQVT
jgi:methylglutamate dehydrogenase subunit D